MARKKTAGPPNSASVGGVLLQSYVNLPKNVKMTPEQKSKFLELYKKTGKFYSSAKEVGLYAGNVADQEMERDPEFALAVNDVSKIRAELIEEEAYARAVIGWEEPVFYMGRIVGHIRKKSDALLTMLLKAEMPHKYRENININANVRGGVLLLDQPMDEAMWEAVAEKMRKDQMKLAIGSEQVIDQEGQPVNDITRA